MRKLLTLLSLLLLSPLLLGSSAVNPSVNGNLGGFQATDPVAYTPTFTNMGTVSGVNVVYERDGKYLIAHGTFTTGSVATSTMSISLPSGLSIDTSVINSTNQFVGWILRSVSSTTPVATLIVSTGSTTTAVNLGGAFGASSANPLAGTYPLNSSETESFWFRVPVAQWSSTSPGTGSSGTTDYIQLEGGNSEGSTNTAIRRFLTVEKNTARGVITYADSATNGASFTAVVKCRVHVVYIDEENSTNNSVIGLSLNSTQLTTSITSITAATRVSIAQGAGVSSMPIVAPADIEMNAGDVLRAHVNASLPPKATSTTYTKLTLIAVQE